MRRVVAITEPGSPTQAAARLALRSSRHSRRR